MCGPAAYCSNVAYRLSRASILCWVAYTHSRGSSTFPRTSGLIVLPYELHPIEIAERNSSNHALTSSFLGGAAKAKLSMHSGPGVSAEVPSQ